MTKSALAELCGILAGDGHLSRYISVKRTDYKVSVFGHRNNDREYLISIKALFQTVLPIIPKILITKKQCELRIDSKMALEYFERLEIPVGNKSAIVFIPSWIKPNLELRCRFIRGLADTDFSVMFRKRKKVRNYPRITTDLKSFQMITDLTRTLNSLGINYSGPYKRNRWRNDTKCITYQIDVNGHKNVKKWLNKIGFRNPKHIKKLKKEGFEVPPLMIPPTRIEFASQKNITC